MKLTSRIENEIIITKKENTLSRNEIIKKKENITLRKIYIHINSLLHFGFWSRETSAVHRSSGFLYFYVEVRRWFSTFFRRETQTSPKRVFCIVSTFLYKKKTSGSRVLCFSTSKVEYSRKRSRDFQNSDQTIYLGTYPLSSALDYTHPQILTYSIFFK